MVVPRKVFAHYVVGLTFNQTLDQWRDDIAAASASALDGFALNVGAQDAYTLTGLRHAYQAAAEAASDFSLFLSFDFSAADGWSIDKVANFTSTFKDEKAQFKVDGRPLVSTFEGPAFAESWKLVRERVEGGIHFVPDWASLAPEGVGRKVDLIDGAFNFNAWPNAGEPRLTTDEDERYKKALNGKTYMMGVSPYFYTRLPTLNKNWYSSSDSLWADRWAQVLAQQPDIVQIISWNDFGESHYIADTVPAQVLPAARPFVDAHPHEAFRFVLPYYVAAYKAGRTSVPVPSEMGDGGAVAWYRTTPANVSGCADGGTAWGQGGSRPAREGTVDSVNVLAVAVKDTTVKVSIGGRSKELQVKQGAPQYFQVPLQELGGQFGAVKVEMGSESVTGPAILDECPANDIINFNAVAVKVALPRTAAADNQNPDGSGSGSGSSKPNAASSGRPSSWMAFLAPALLFALFF